MRARGLRHTSRDADRLERHAFEAVGNESIATRRKRLVDGPRAGASERDGAASITGFRAGRCSARTQADALERATGRERNEAERRVRS